MHVEGANSRACLIRVSARFRERADVLSNRLAVNRLPPLVIEPGNVG